MTVRCRWCGERWGDIYLLGHIVEEHPERTTTEIGLWSLFGDIASPLESAAVGKLVPEWESLDVGDWLVLAATSNPDLL